jgi:hypothetical protein
MIKSLHYWNKQFLQASLLEGFIAGLIIGGMVVSFTWMTVVHNVSITKQTPVTARAVDIQTP